MDKSIIWRGRERGDDKGEKEKGNDKGGVIYSEICSI
jgi:hypothetical protein